jgi:FkbM family methyltransferase
MYYDRKIYTMSAQETFVDCGGFDGDSLRTFLRRTDGRFDRAYVLEPDPANRAQLAASLERLEPADRAKVEILPYAVGEHNGTLHFDPDHGPGSTANDAGTLEVECRRLDDIIPGKPTLIKIDIEGAEPFALRGAARMIREARPVIAIVAYHYSEHLWELPKLLHELAPDAKLYFRRHADHCWETIFYAVPPERCVEK